MFEVFTRALVIGGPIVLLTLWIFEYVGLRTPQRGDVRLLLGIVLWAAPAAAMIYGSTKVGGEFELWIQAFAATPGTVLMILILTERRLELTFKMALGVFVAAFAVSGILIGIATLGGPFNCSVDGKYCTSNPPTNGLPIQLLSVSASIVFCVTPTFVLLGAAYGTTKLWKGLRARIGEA